MKNKPTPKYLSGAELLALADAEAQVLRPRDFLPAVDKLREKGHSWRSCAEWLEKHAGISINHAHLYRLSRDREALDRNDEES